MASKAGNSSAASNKAGTAASAANSVPNLKELEDMERKLMGELVKIENDIYITETKYMK